MNQPSHYQTGFFRELTSRPGISIAVFYATDVPRERRELGWQSTGLEKFDQTYLDRAWWPWALLRAVWCERRSIHLINGIWAVPKFFCAAVLLICLRASVFFHSEAPNPELTRGGVFRLFKRVMGSWLINASRGIFVIGQKAGDYYGKLGVWSDKIFRFAYFVAGSPRASAPVERTPFYRITYIGQFIERKRVGDLFAAAGVLRGAGIKFKLRLVGTGPLRATFEREIAIGGLNIDTAVEGPLDPSKVPAILTESDVLVLPSKFDGWGLTVNEALHVGVPVVVSDGCAAAELLRTHPQWGVAYPAGDCEALARALLDIYRRADFYRPIPAEVDGTMGCPVMTDYFLCCLDWALGSSSTLQTKPALSWCPKRGQLNILDR